jgi:hypothetical protein
MFDHGLNCWDYIQVVSTLIIMKRFNITSAVLVLDDSVRRRRSFADRLFNLAFAGGAASLIAFLI